MAELTWSKDKPEAEGWYGVLIPWRGLKPSRRIVLVRTDSRSQELTIEGEAWLLGDERVSWYGPIALPDLPQEPTL